MEKIRYYSMFYPNLSKIVLTSMIKGGLTNIKRIIRDIKIID